MTKLEIILYEYTEKVLNMNDQELYQLFVNKLILEGYFFIFERLIELKKNSQSCFIECTIRDHDFSEEKIVYFNSNLAEIIQVNFFTFSNFDIDIIEEGLDITFGKDFTLTALPKLLEKNKNITDSLKLWLEMQ